jgi:hypothetical protein
MIKFSKVTEPEYYTFDPSDIMKEIATSCSATLDKYAQIHIKTPHNGTVIHALAAFTLGSMMRFSKSTQELSKAENYINLSIKALINKFQLKHYNIPEQFMLGQICYENFIAIQKEEKRSDFDKLKTSCNHGYLPACFLLAQHYVKEYNAKKPLSININDFLPLLQKHTTEDTEINAKYKEIARQVLSIQVEIAKTESIDTLVKNKKILKYFCDDKDHQLRLKINSLGITNKIKEIIPSLENAVKEWQSPNAFLLLALNYLTKEIVKQDFNISQAYLTTALYTGLCAGATKKDPKLFYDSFFLNTLSLYIKILIEEKYPNNINQTQLSLIYKALREGNINLTDFYEIFTRITAIHLSNTPEWQKIINK